MRRWFQVSFAIKFFIPKFLSPYSFPILLTREKKIKKERIKREEKREKEKRARNKQREREERKKERGGSIRELYLSENIWIHICLLLESLISSQFLPYVATQIASPKRTAKNCYTFAGPFNFIKEISFFFVNSFNKIFFFFDVEIFNNIFSFRNISKFSFFNFFNINQCKNIFPLLFLFSFLSTLIILELRERAEVKGQSRDPWSR